MNAVNSTPIGVLKPSSTGADLGGWSSLALLGHVTSRTAPWLFVMNRTTAWLSSGPVAQAEFEAIAGAFDQAWPFRDGEIGGVVLDGDALSGVVPLQHVLSESLRVNGRQGNVLVSCGHRWWPRRLHALNEYGRHSEQRWRRAAAQMGLSAPAIGFVRIDGERIVQLSLDAQQPDAGTVRRDADKAILRIATSGRRDAGVLRGMVADASRACGVTLQIDRVSVRKIGKTAVFLSGPDGERCIMRVARSPIALARAARNYRALERLHSPSLPAALRRQVPAPVLRGVHAGYHYFVESCLRGRSGPLNAPSTQSWNADAVQFITALHEATAQPVTIDSSVLTPLVHDPLAILLRASRTDHTRVLESVRRAIEHSMIGCRVPLVQTHGDFTETNCLFDSGQLSGVVDWEVSSETGLPLGDLLQLMPAGAESASDARWNRFDVWSDLLRSPQRLLNAPMVAQYVQTLQLPVDAIPGLVLAHWIGHVAERIDARCDDERWMRMRYLQPLDLLGAVL